MIGIVSAPVTINKMDCANSYLYNPYIEWIKMSGEQCIIIPYDITKIELKKILNRVQGVVWVGGSIDKTHTPTQTSTLINTLNYIYKYAILENNNNNYYPIWAICLGLELMIMFAKEETNLKDSIQKYEQYNNTSFAFTDSSRLKKWFSPSMQKQMKNKLCVSHHHTYAYTAEPIDHVHITSIEDGYINSIEFNEYPFYGVQFHPERPFNDFSLKVSREFSLFFKNECSKNKNKWEWIVADFKKTKIFI